MFSCEYCKIFKNNYFRKHPRTAVSVFKVKFLIFLGQKNSETELADIRNKCEAKISMKKIIAHYLRFSL